MSVAFLAKWLAVPGSRCAVRSVDRLNSLVDLGGGPLLSASMQAVRLSSCCRWCWIGLVSNVPSLLDFPVSAWFLGNDRCRMRRIRSKASRAGFQASEEKRVQKVEVLEVERRPVQVRSGLTPRSIAQG